MEEVGKEDCLGAEQPTAPDVELASSPAIPMHPTREAMSWIRALANDWEDERSHSEPPK
jgi:hypothetical protein